MAHLIPTRSLLHRLSRAAALALAGTTAFALLAAVSPPPLEQAIKASFITKFAPFVEWPAAAFPSPSSPFTICVAGRDPYGTVLDEVARGQKVRGRPMQIRRIGDAPPIGGCHMLVVGAGQPAAALAQVAGEPVLTVTDRTAGRERGMISFVRQAGRVRFEIDNGAARAVHLTISSKLLGLAVTVNK